MSVSHRLGSKPRQQGQDTRPIIVKFCRRDVKYSIRHSCRSLRPKDLFVNESLTPVRNQIFKTLRYIRKQHNDIVTGCGTSDGKIFAYTKSSPTTAEGAGDKRHCINTMEALNQFCRIYVKQPIDNFLNNLN